MSAHPLMFFQAAALRQRYLDDLATAATESRITEAQRQWLELLVESIRLARAGNMRPALGRLTTDDGFWEATTACTGLLIGSEQAGDWTLFWYSPFTGLRQFTSRKRLVGALNGWLELPAGASQWSVEWFAGDPFEQLEALLIGGRAECLRRLGEQLLQLPSLGDVLGAPAAERFAEAVAQPGPALLARGQAGLEGFWSSAQPGQPTRRQLAAQALTDSFGAALLASRQRGEVSEPEFNALRTLLPGSAALASGLTAGTLALAIGEQSVPLAGVLVVSLDDAVLVFSVWGVLRRFDTLSEHEAYFSKAANRQELLTCVSLAQQALVTGAQAVQLQPQWLAQGHFLRLADGCIAWQALNLKQGLNKLEAPLNQACSAVDDAQDVRPLLDSGLVAMDGRWRELSGQPPESVTPAVLALANDQPGMEQWSGFQLRALQQIDVMAALQPGAFACAQAVLGRYLALFGTSPLWVSVDGRPPVSLATLLLQRMSGYSQAPLPGDAQVVEGGEALPAQQRKHSTISPRLLDVVLKLAANAFDAAFDAQVRRSRMRVQGLQLQPAALAQSLLAGLLRQALALELRRAQLKPANLSMLKQVLDHPALAQRRGLGQQAAEVYGLAVQYDVRQGAATLNGAFVLQRSTSNLSTLLLWSPLSGLHEFDTDAALQATIKLGLSDLSSRTAWLGLVSEPARSQLAYALSQPDTARLAVQLVAIEGSFIEHLQAGEARHQCLDTMAALQSARARHCTALQIERAVVAAQAQDGMRNAIGAVAQAMELEHFVQVLPGWLSAACIAELEQLADLLQQYYASHRPGLDFMSGIPGLQAHAREKLRAALAMDFPGAQLDSDRIALSWVQYTTAPPAPGELPSALPAATRKVTGNLTDYAVNRLFSPPDATLTVDVAGGFTGVTRLNVTYLEGLVRQLDVAASYRSLLEQALSPHAAGYPQRLQRFARQFAARLRLAAFELRLRNLLSARAVTFINRIVDMPDGLARQPLEGEHVLICPFQLQAEEGRAPDVARGMYLIGCATGPWVLLALQADGLELREYADLPAILADLQADTALAGLVLQRLDPQARRTYDHGGFTEPHLPWSTEDSFGVRWASPAPPQLPAQPLLSNACKHAFEATLALLLAQAREQSVTSAESDSYAWRYLLSLGADQLLAFLPGKLGLLVTAWQAGMLASQALDAARERRWGQAFTQFCAALAMLVSSRQEAYGRQPHAAAQTAGATRHAAPVAERLRQFEVHDIATSELEKEALSNLYRDPLRNHRYAVVEGKLYRVRNDAGGWRIVWHEVSGPFIRLNPAQEWELKLGLQGGGPLASRFQGAVVEADLEQIFTVEAEGLPQIRQLYVDKARRIGQAHLWGCNYLRTALDNLQANPGTGQLPPATLTLLGNFFGVRSPDPQLIGRVTSALRSLLDTFLDPSLSPWSSSRFVVGTGKDKYEDIPAFTYANDPQKRIFLGRRFFSALQVRLKPPPSGQNGFEQGAHFRASVLLHELSHIAHGNFDIAYIDAVLPYLDLIENTGLYYSMVKRGIEKCQQRTLSHLTPRDELFTDTLTDGAPRDLDVTDNGALEAVLRITGCKTLDQARDVFLQNAQRRAEVILANADSVSLLTTLLGRTRFTAPAV